MSAASGDAATEPSRATKTHRLSQNNEGDKRHEEATAGPGGGAGRERRRAGGRHQAGRRRRPARPRHPPQHLWPVRRAPGHRHLRRHVGGPRVQDPQCARLAQGRRRGAEGPEGAAGALARRLLRRRIPLARRHRPAQQAAGQGQHHLGRRGREQRRRHARVLRPRRAARRRGLRQRQYGHRQPTGNGRVAGVHDGRGPLHAGRAAPQERPRQALPRALLRRRQRDLGLRRQYAARVLRRPVPALGDFPEDAREQPAQVHRQRQQRPGHHLGGRAEQERARQHRRHLPPRLHLPQRQVGGQGLGGRLPRERVDLHAVAGQQDRQHADQDHGRPRQERPEEEARDLL